MKDEDNIDIPNFDCVVRFKRPDVRAAGVAVYRNNVNNTNIVTPNLTINLQQPSILSVNTAAIGDICAAECLMEDQQKILMVAIYIYPNHSTADIIKFIHRSLAIYTAEIAPFIDPELARIPMILSGDFNVNFASAEAKPLIDFLNDKLQLQMTNDRTEATTRSGTTIDARFLNRLQSKVFVSYFSYHKPIISFVEHSDMEIE